MRKDKIYRLLASHVDAYIRCSETGNSLWEERYVMRIKQLARDFMPSGSGFDTGTKFDFKESQGEKLVFNTSYHHMNENGFYDGWTDHSIIVKPSLVHEFHLRITGRDRNDTKDYMHECFDCALREIVEWDETNERYKPIK